MIDRAAAIFNAADYKTNLTRVSCYVHAHALRIYLGKNRIFTIL